MKRGSRFCHAHNCHYESMLAQVVAAGEKPMFIDTMKDDRCAADEVDKFARENAGVSKFKRKKQISWAQRRERFGSRVSQVSVSKVEPYEEEEWILRQIAKFGRTRQAAKRMWDDHEKTKVRRDFEGASGSLRLWLPKKSYVEDKTELFIEGAAEEGSEQIRGASDVDRDGLRMHVHHKGISASHEFFDGKSSLSLRRPTTATPAPSSVASSVAVESAPSTVASGTLIKRKVVDLEGSDDSGDDDNNVGESSPKRSKKGGKALGPVGARTFEQTVDKLEGVTHYLRELVSKADATLLESNKQRMPLEKAASVRTREVYVRQLEIHRNVVASWLGDGLLAQGVRQRLCVCARFQNLWDLGTC